MRWSSSLDAPIILSGFRGLHLFLWEESSVAVDHYVPHASLGKLISAKLSYLYIDRTSSAGGDQFVHC